MTPQRIRPALRWPGGKGRLLKKLLPLIPPHVCYCEPFAGSAAMLLAKKRSPVEVLNDLNGDLIALYRNAQYHLPELLREIEWLHSSRKNLHDFIAQPGLTEIQRAVRFLYRNRISFGGNMNSFGVAKTGGGGVAFDHNKQAAVLGPLHERLNGVVIENISYERCFKNYDSKDTVFFCDPPYTGSKIKAYNAWEEKDVLNFRKNLDRLKGFWIVTLDGSESNRAIFKDCRIESVETQSRAVNILTHGKKMFSEIIITPK